MGEIVSFRSDGDSCDGYLALPAAGRGRGLLVVQEWWGLVPHIKDVTDRFAREGFVGLAPDLYHGKTTTEPDQAQKWKMEMDLDLAARDMSGAIEYLAGRPEVLGDGVGAVGFCMGGRMMWLLACLGLDRLKAAVPFYGLLAEQRYLEWSRLTASIQGHFAEHDEGAPADRAQALGAELRALGKDVEIFVYPGTLHGFFNDDYPDIYHPEAARTAWDRSIRFLRSKLG
jgi:carboxymethylenebutenolidase